MMEILQLANRSALAEYFSRDVSLHAYSLGDLDDFFWPQTTFYGLQGGTGLDKVAALYRGSELPVLLALAEPGALDRAYIKGLLALLPDRFYAHLSPGVEDHFSEDCTIQDHGLHIKMDLADSGKLQSRQLETTCRLTVQDLPDLEALYALSYPENSFDPRTLGSGQYFGYREQGRLLSAGGIHVYSPAYRVATLGNITTHPQFRNRGLARAVTVRLCLSLLDSVDFVGLNVKADNHPAIGLYQSLGFKISSEYGEFSLQKA